MPPASVRTHMERELHEQPARLRLLLERGGPAVDAAARAITAARCEWLLIAARGSSDNAARYAQYLFGVRQRLAVALAAPSLFTVYDSAPSLNGAAVLVLSQSGQSPDIVACAAAATAAGRPALALTNDAGSPLARAANQVIELGAGEERAVAATKTYSATLLALAMLSSALGPAANDELARVPDWLDAVLGLGPSLDGALESLTRARKVLVVARGFNYCTAHELALKIGETSYVPAQAYSLADLRHGPLALVDSSTAVILIAVAGATQADSAAAFEELLERGAKLVVIADDPRFGAGRAPVLPLPAGVPEWLSPLPAAAAAQLLSHELSLSLGHDPDRPRGLSKITRTR